MPKIKDLAYYQKTLDKYYRIHKQAALPEKEFKKIEKAFEGFETIEDEKLIIKIHSIFITQIKYSNELENRDLIYKNYLIKLLPFFEKYNQYEKLGISFKQLSYIERVKGDYSNAINYINKSIENFILFGNPIKTAGAINSLGTIYIEIGDYNNALIYLYKAFEQIKSHKDVESYYIIKQNLAKIYLELYYFSKAKDLYFQDLIKIEEEQNYERLATSLEGIATIYLEEKQYNKAYKYALLAN